MANTVYEILMTLTGQRQVTQDLNAAEKNVNLLAQATQAVAPGLISAGDAMMSFSDRASYANAEMERGLTNLQNITNKTREEMLSYNEGLEGVLVTTGYQISQNDLLTASYDAASSGFTEQAEALSIVEEAAKLAIAGNSGLTDATDNMAASQKALVAGLKSYGDELSVYGDSTEQAAIVSDRMFKVVKLGITDIKQLAPEFAELAPLAASAGMSLDELSASYAAMTSAGIKTTISTTALKALLSSIARGGGTEESKKMIDEMGLSFDVTALKTEGLVGILEILKEKGVTGMDQYLKLTGSVEASTALAALSAQDFAGALEYTSGKMEDLQGIVDNTSSDPMGRLTAATQKFDAELAKAGDSMVPFNTQIKEMAGDVLAAFNDMPEEFKNIVGPVVGWSGAALTAGGNAIQLASNIAISRIAYMQWKAEVVKATFASGAQTTATGLASGGLRGLAASSYAAMGAQKGLGFTMTATTASMGAFIASAAIATAAIAALTFALVQHEKNKATVRENEAIGEAYAETEVLVQKTQALVGEMRKTGEALPDEEFQQWLKLMEEADGGTGVLKLQMEAFVRIQEKAKQGNLETTAELNKGTAATRDFGAEAEAAAAKLAEKAEADEKAAKAAEKQAKATKKQEEAQAALIKTLEDAISKSKDVLANNEQDLANKVAEGTVTTQEAYQSRVQVLNTYAASANTLYANLLQSEVLSDKQKSELMAKQVKELRDTNQKKLELHRQWAADLKKINEEQNQIELLALETRAANEKWSAFKTGQETRKLKAQQLEATLESITTELNAVKHGSQRQRELTLELYRTKAEQAKNSRGYVDAEIAEQMRIQEAQKKAVEDSKKAEKDKLEAAKKAAEDAKNARIKAWTEETGAFKNSLDAQVQAATNASQRIQDALAARASMNSLKSGELGNFEGGLGTRTAALEKVREITAQIAELEAEQAQSGESKAAEIAKLNGELEVQNKVVALTTRELEASSALLGEMGLKVAANLTGEQATLAIAQAKLTIENQQIALKLQQESIGIRLKQLEQDRLILELQRQKTSEEVTANERKNLDLQIANAQETKRALAESLRVSQELSGFQQASNVSGARMDLASKGVDPGMLGKELGAANLALAREVDQSFATNLQAVTAAQQQATQTNSVEQQAQTTALTGSLTTLGAGVATAINPVSVSVSRVDGNLVQGFGANVAATQAQTQELRSQLEGIRQATQALPGQIAKLMPRESPPARR